jgi:hypothetical protein
LIATVAAVLQLENVQFVIVAAALDLCATAPPITAAPPLGAAPPQLMNELCEMLSVPPALTAPPEEFEPEGLIRTPVKAHPEMVAESVV